MAPLDRTRNQEISALLLTSYVSVPEWEEVHYSSPDGPSVKRAHEEFDYKVLCKLIRVYYVVWLQSDYRFLYSLHKVQQFTVKLRWPPLFRLVLKLKNISRGGEIWIRSRGVGLTECGKRLYTGSNIWAAAVLVVLVDVIWELLTGRNSSKKCHFTPNITWATTCHFWDVINLHLCDGAQSWSSF